MKNRVLCEVWSVPFIIRMEADYRAEFRLSLCFRSFSENNPQTVATSPNPQYSTLFVTSDRLLIMKEVEGVWAAAQQLTAAFHLYLYLRYSQIKFYIFFQHTHTHTISSPADAWQRFSLQTHQCSPAGVSEEDQQLQSKLAPGNRHQCWHVLLTLRRTPGVWHWLNLNVDGNTGTPNGVIRGFQGPLKTYPGGCRDPWGRSRGGFRDPGVLKVDPGILDGYFRWI